MNFKDQLILSLKRLFSSSKTITMIAGFIVYLAAKKGIVLSPDDVQGILILFGTLLGAQGLNDLGKGKAQVEAANPKMPEQVNIQNLNPPAEPVEAATPKKPVFNLEV